jgi:ribosomal protein S12 methylthiotransferase accessory factor
VRNWDLIDKLVQPMGGLFGTVLRSKADVAEPAIVTRVALLDNIEAVRDVSEVEGRILRYEGLSGCGTGLRDQDALFLAVAEGLERYCACIYENDNFIRATAQELGSEALDLDQIPRCSSAEVSQAKCPITLPDKIGPIRWVRGISLTTGQMTYIPAVMTYLLLRPLETERFWLPISTGCAAHESYSAAIVSGILEVIERDALSIIWLQRCPIPKIEFDVIPEELQPYWSRYESSSADLQYSFYDATTDIGVPTIYCVRVAQENQALTTMVACCCSLNPSLAVAKVICDLTALRLALRNPISIPEDRHEFTGVFHGAAFMARTEQQSSFDFILKSARHKFFSTIKPLCPGTPNEQLCSLLRMLRASQMDVYVVDLTTDEALRCGMRVVRVLIPALQPLSFHYRARYLGHGRLYRAPILMGYRAHQEADLNHWPQPFA